MSPSAEIASLDRLIAENGQGVSLIFVEPSSETSFPTRAFVRGYLPQELIEGIIQGDTLAVISATGLAGSPRLPRRNDKISVNGAQKHIENVQSPIYLGGELVRMNLQVKGA